MSSSLPPWMEKIGLDKKKLLMMAGLLAVALLLWGRLLLKQVPRTAVATPKQAAQLSGSDDPVDIAVRRKRKIVHVDLPTTLERDLFALNDDGYEVLADKLPIVAEVEETTGEQPEEAAFPLADLELQAVIRGRRPLAMINSKMYRPGQIIEGYKLIEVGDRQVILEHDGKTYTLDLNIDLEF